MLAWHRQRLLQAVKCSRHRQVSFFSAPDSVKDQLDYQASNHDSPSEDHPTTSVNSFISVSTTFYPGAQHIHDEQTRLTDLIIVSSDSVFFYVHSYKLLRASTNGFNGLVPANIETKDVKEPDVVLSVPESSQVINIILHTVYGMNCAHYSPTLQDLTSALVALGNYGMPPKTIVVEGTPLYDALRCHATTDAMELYTIDELLTRA